MVFCYWEENDDYLVKKWEHPDVNNSIKYTTDFKKSLIESKVKA